MIPLSVRTLLGRPKVLPSEQKKFWQELEALKHAHDPGSDHYVWRLLADYAYATIEQDRKRSVVLGVLGAGFLDALEQAFARIYPNEVDRIPSYIKEWFADENARLRHLENLRAHGISEEMLQAEAFLNRFSQMQVLEQLIDRKPALRSRLINDLYEYRSRKAKISAAQAQPIIEAEIVES
jgi:hypothetical protein